MDLFSSFSLLLCQLLIPLLHAANVTEPSGLSNQIAVRIEGGVEKAKEIARRHHCEFIGQIGSLEDHYLFEHERISRRSSEDSTPAHARLKDDPEVLWMEQQQAKVRVKRDFDGFNFGNLRMQMNELSTANKAMAPHNALVEYAFKDPYYPQQWYLHKGAHGGFDMNVEKAWRRGYSGKGISISILDDGVQPDHPDLKENYDPLASLDINGKDDDPTPSDDGNNKHGTRCAGEVSAVAGNDICGVGIAFHSSIGGVRMLDGEVHDSVEATALSLNPQHVHIYSASWGPNDDGQTVDGPGTLAKRAFENGINNGRNGLGSVFVWASGNGGKSQDSCSCDGYTNSIYTISVSSAAQDGSRPWYLEECPSTLATTYSSGSALQPSIVTTDLYMPNNGMQACTNKHTGTSASAPLAAGIIALVLEANPRLNWRDLQYLTVLSARPEPLIHGDENWSVNGVGRKISNRFGYGLMDADKMVQLAEKWVTVPEQHICYTQQYAQRVNMIRGRLTVDISTDGCQNSPNGIFFLEHVQVVLSIQALHRGSVVIKLTSPMGTTSVMLPPRPLDTSNAGFSQWPFMSVQFWGENPVGTWHVDIQESSFDPKLGSSQILLTSWSMALYGVYTDPLANQAKATSSSDRQGSAISSGASTLRPSVPSKSATTLPPQSTLNCHLSCKNCHGPRYDDCSSCFAGYYFHNSQCLLACPNGFFSVNTTFTCSSCPAKCTSCLSDATCLSCQTGYVLEKGQCVALHSAVDDECLHGFFFDHRASKCKNCHSDCTTCTGPLVTDCLICKPPKVLYKTCLASCPSNFTVSNGSCVPVRANGPSHVVSLGEDRMRPSGTFFLTATIACIVIISIGLVVFCVLQAASDSRRKRKGGVASGAKYEKAPTRSNGVESDSDEEVETFSRRELSDAFHT